MTVTALHFGSSGKELFGIYHVPAGGAGRTRAVLLCNPLGQEQIRAHRIMRVLAERLANDGAHVLRFDYFGNGDSAGSTAETTLQQCSEDILSAHQELKDISGANRVLWIGLRLGASLAVASSARKPEGLAGLVLWDPIADGRAYLAELAAAHAAYLDEPAPATAPTLPPALANGNREAVGFEIGAELEAELKALDFGTIEYRPARKALLVAAGDSQAAAVLASAMTAQGTKVDRIEDNIGQAWNTDEAMNAFVVPAETINAIALAAEGWR